jgi:hypothetical protein
MAAPLEHWGQEVLRDKGVRVVRRELRHRVIQI